MQHHYPASESPPRASALAVGLAVGPPGLAVAGAGLGVAGRASAASAQQDCCFPDWLPPFTSPMKEMEGQ